MAYWDNFSWVSSTSPITNLLEKDDTTLENVLDEDEILSELRNSNEALIEYFSKPETLYQVLNYLTKPHPELSEDLQYRYPYLCSEMLCYDSANIYEEILTDDMLDRLFAFLYEEPTLNGLLSSYFNRIVSYILNKKIDPLLEYLQKKDGFLDQVAVHIYSPAVSDIILKLLVSSKEETVDAWFVKEQFVSKLISKLNPSESAAVHENVSEILCKICSASFQKLNAGLDQPEVFKQLNQEENISKIVELIFQEPTSSSLQFGGSILIELGVGQQSDIFDTTTTEEKLPTVFRILLQSLDDIKNALETDPEETIETSCGKIAPFGFRRMRALTIFQTLVGSKFTCVYQQLLAKNLFTCCLDLFFKYSWNNFVHALVTDACKTLLACNEDDIIQQFIQQSKLHERIGDAGAVPNVNGEKSSRKGFMGHLATLATCLHSASEVNSQLEDVLEASDVWKKYMQADFATIKKIEATPLGNAADGSGDGENREIDQLISNFQEITKRGFEDDFPDSFTPSNDAAFDILIQPTDNKMFTGINTDEDELEELNSDDENFMASDDDDDEYE